MLDFITKIFSTKHEKDIKEILPIVEEINNIYETLRDISDDELKHKTVEFKEKIQSELNETESRLTELKEQLKSDLEHEVRINYYDEIEKLEKENKEILEAVLDDILPEAFAVLKETARRLCGKEWEAAGEKVKWNMVHYDVQLIGGIVLHSGKISEMATGEGKTLVATLPMYLNALSGKGVHLVTVNDYLAKRDSEWMGELFKFHGLTVGVILNNMDSEQRRNMYNCDITYGTNNEFGFDYLRDNMVIDKEMMVQRGHHYAIVDEVDSVLIDEARTPLIISGPVESGTQKFNELNPRVKSLFNAQKSLVNNLVARAEKLLENDNISSKDRDEAGLLLLRSYRGLPKHKKLLKVLSEPAHKKLMQDTQMFYLRDNAKEMYIVDDEMYFIIDEKSHVTDLTEKGRELLAPSSVEKDFFTLPDLGSGIAEIENDSSLTIDEKLSKKDELTNTYSERSERLHIVHQLLKAYALYEKDDEYVIQDGKIMIVDEFTGRILPGRRYSDGLHQAIEAKEGVKVEKDTQTLATITLQNYFRLYDKLAGMTGTAETEASEFMDIYNWTLLLYRQIKRSSETI